jgi:hypothetical protein
LFGWAIEYTISTHEWSRAGHLSIGRWADASILVLATTHGSQTGWVGNPWTSSRRHRSEGSCVRPTQQPVKTAATESRSDVASCPHPVKRNIQRFLVFWLPAVDSSDPLSCTPVSVGVSVLLHALRPESAQEDNQMTTISGSWLVQHKASQAALLSSVAHTNRW